MALCVAVLQLLWLVVILGVMVSLYISPLYILCPCITTSPSMPHKPKLFAHRGAEGVSPDVYVSCKLQALVYNILPSTTAVFSYAIGSRKLSANEQFFVGAQTVVSLLQTTQIKQGVSFIVAHKVYTSTNKTTIV